MTTNKQPLPAPRIIQWFSRTTDYLLYDFLGGPKLLKFSWVINFQKGATLLWVALLMWHYQNDTVQAWVYLALHGTYGLCWLLKDRVFPDPKWEHRITFGGALVAVVSVLGPYWLIPWLLISDTLGPEHQGASLPWLCVAIAACIFGVAMMMVADAQKFFTLKLKKGLISDGIFARVRHPNYTGEMLIYGSFALVAWHWVAWAILLWVWIGLFMVNILMKEASMSRYPDWQAYKQRSGYLLPKLW